MRRWQRPLAALGLILVSALLIVVLPLSSLAAPAGASGTPHFLPVVLKNSPQTSTPTTTSTSTSTPTPTPTETQTATPTGTRITPTIPITVGPVSGVEMLIFSPKTVTIHAGDTVRWTWGSSGHTVTSGPAGTPDNQFCSPSNANCSTVVTSSQGATFDHQFLVPGTYNYFCQIHWMFGMTGTVVVQP
jgi:plastocyanin